MFRIEKEIFNDRVNIRPVHQCSSSGLVDGGGVLRYTNRNVQEIELIRGVTVNYDISIFGELKEVLSEMEFKLIITPISTTANQLDSRTRSI